MTVSERWEAWDEATPREQQVIIACFIGVHGDDFDWAVEHARKVTSEEVGR